MMGPQTQQLEQKLLPSLYVNFLDPSNFEPCLTFLTVAELNKNQDAPGSKKALFN